MQQTGKLNALITEPAVWSALWRIGGALEISLLEIFASDYSQSVRRRSGAARHDSGVYPAVPDACPSGGSRMENHEGSREIDSAPSL